MKERRGALRNRLEELIFNEMVAWRQKMKFRWIKEWDANTKLFHKLLSNQRNKSLISRLDTDDDSVLEDKEKIEKRLFHSMRNYSKRRRQSYGFLRV